MLRPRSKNTQPTQLSSAVRELRDTFAMTQDAFAAKLGTTLTTVARYETSERIPRARTLLALAKLADAAGKPELSALFRRTFGVEFREVTRKGYEALISAPMKEALGIRELTTADLMRLKKLLVEMYQLGAAFDRKNLTLLQARQVGRDLRAGIAAAAELLLTEGLHDLGKQ